MRVPQKESSKKKISQLIMPRLEGKLLTDPSYFKKIKTLVTNGIGGFILFGGRFADVKKAIKELQDMSETLLLISSDLEQGLGQQIEGGTLFPKAMAIASAIDPENPDDIKLLRDAIEIMSIEANDVGINVILAPVIDVNTNSKNPIICTRAFSDDPEKVAWFGKEFINGIESSSVSLIACAKHFPGHGDTEIDSHTELPVIISSIERLKRIELFPFIEAIKTGVRMIMVGHLRVDVLDRERPATLSHKVIQGLLRKELGFDGIVITDAMNMGAIKKAYQENEACLMALQAGADIILHPENPESVIEYLSSQEGIELRLEESLERIVKAKERLKYSKEVQRSNIKVKSRKASLKIAEVLSEKAIKVIKGSPRFMENSFILIFDDDNSDAGKNFIENIRLKYPALEFDYISSQNVSSEKIKVLDKIKYRPVTVGIFSKVSALKGRSGIGTELYQFLKDISRESYNSTLISFGSPYILDGIEADALIAAYGDSDLSQKAAAKILFKEA